MERLDECVSCGERLSRREDLTNVPFDVQDQMQVRCKSCAMEVLDMTVYRVGNLQHDTGGGQRVIRSTKSLS